MIKEETGVLKMIANSLIRQGFTIRMNEDGLSGFKKNQGKMLLDCSAILHRENDKLSVEISLNGFSGKFNQNELNEILDRIIDPLVLYGKTITQPREVAQIVLKNSQNKKREDINSIRINPLMVLLSLGILTIIMLVSTSNESSLEIIDDPKVEKSQSAVRKFYSFNEAEEHMIERCASINQLYLRGKEIEIEGKSLYCFLSASMDYTTMYCVTIFTDDLVIIKAKCADLEAISIVWEQL